MAGLGRRTFTPGEVLTATNVMGYLQDQAVMKFAGTAARGSAIGTAVAEGMVSYLADTDSVEVYDGSAWKRIANTSGAILQVVSTTKTDTFSMSSTTFADVTGLSATISPTSTTSKVFVLASVHLGAGNLVNNYVRLLRGSTVIAGGGTLGSRAVGFGMLRPPDAYTSTTQTTNYLDSPATTSSTTYKIQIAGNVPSAVYVNRNDNDGDSFNNIRTSSTITLIEVSA